MLNLISLFFCFFKCRWFGKPLRKIPEAEFFNTPLHIGLTTTPRLFLAAALLLGLAAEPTFAHPSESGPVAAGEAHTCALTTGGGVKCWGFNHAGQLGYGTINNRPNPTPVEVEALSSGVAAIAASYHYTCALTTGGGVKCWGINNVGQLGDSIAIDNSSPTPVDVVGLSSGVAAIAAGDFHICVLTTDGGVKCWGQNNSGQLGNGISSGQPGTPYYDDGSSATPTDVESLSNGVAAIAAGESHTCALTTGSGVKCWGYNRSGQLGDGSIIHRPTPVDVLALSSGVTAIAVGEVHTCALTTVGGVKCWGSNYYGQLGNGSTTDYPTPVEVPALSPIPVNESFNPSFQ